MRSETDSEEHDLKAAFIKAIATLAEGELTFPPPFDLPTSAALAANLDSGRIAQAIFDVTQMRDVTYLVQIAAAAPGVPAREVVNTTVSGTDLLIELLDGLVEELIAKKERDPSGG